MAHRSGSPARHSLTRRGKNCRTLPKVIGESITVSVPSLNLKVVREVPFIYSDGATSDVCRIAAYCEDAVTEWTGLATS